MHAVAHITRKVKRDEFPFATYVFVADQLNLPAGLDHRHPDRPDQERRDVRIAEGRAQHPRLGPGLRAAEKYMGNASYYKALAKVEARNPVDRHLGLQHAGDGCLQEPGGRGVAKIKVDYTPAMAPAARRPSEAEKAQGSSRRRDQADRGLGRSEARSRSG